MNDRRGFPLFFNRAPRVDGVPGRSAAFSTSTRNRVTPQKSQTSSHSFFPSLEILSSNVCSIMEERLDRSFFARPALEIAPDLLGKRLVHHTAEGTFSGIVVETEAYGGTTDPASHAYKGRRTKRNEVMWGPAGHAYIYPIYGIYLCFNVVGGVDGSPEGVFLRAVKPCDGVDLMARNRGMILDERNIRRIANGPSKLCIAFNITRELNGVDIITGPLYFTSGECIDEVTASRRIGVDYAGKGAEYPWRFLIRDSEFVSRPA